MLRFSEYKKCPPYPLHSKKRKVYLEKMCFFLIFLLYKRYSQFKICFERLNLIEKNVAFYSGDLIFLLSYRYLKILPLYWFENFGQYFQFYFKTSGTAKNAQHLQNDKIYHRKERKISYKMVYFFAL